LAVLLRDTPRWTAISDLNWARLTTWRALLAGFYDVAGYRPYLDRLDQIVIEYAPLPGRSEAIAPRALLLGGWLASRLGWQLKTAAQPQGKQAVFELTASGRATAVEFVPTENREIEPGHLAKIGLHVTTADSASFTVRKSSDGYRLETEVVLAAERRAGRVLSYERRSESGLIANELEILGHDRVYEQAVLSAGEMVVALIQA